MELNDARTRIADEFLRRYDEWITDHNGTELSDLEYAKKYGYARAAEPRKDNLATVKVFQSYIFSGRWLPDWVAAGYDKQTIWNLARAGFLSHAEYSNWMARNTGRTDFYYISQRVARDIYKARKSGAALIGKTATITAKDSMYCGEWGTIIAYDGDYYHIAIANGTDSVPVFTSAEFRINGAPVKNIRR